MAGGRGAAVEAPRCLASLGHPIRGAFPEPVFVRLPPALTLPAPRQKPKSLAVPWGKKQAQQKWEAPQGQDPALFSPVGLAQGLAPTD